MVPFFQKFKNYLHRLRKQGHLWGNRLTLFFQGKLRFWQKHYEGSLFKQKAKRLWDSVHESTVTPVLIVWRAWRYKPKKKIEGELPYQKKRVRPKTYSVVIYVVIALGLIQVAALISVFYFRRVVSIRIDTQARPIVVEETAELPQKPVSWSGSQWEKDLQHFSSVASTKEEAPDGSAPLERHGEIPVAKEVSTTSFLAQQALEEQEARKIAQFTRQAEKRAARIQSLNEEAEHFLENEEMALAKEALEEAIRLNSQDLLTLRRLAMLYAAEGHQGKALKYWKVLFELGPQAGEGYVLAQEEIRRAKRRVQDSPAHEEIAELQEENRLTPPSKYFSIQSLQKTLDKAFPGKNSFQVDVRIQHYLLEEEEFDSRLSIELFFYDQLANRSIVPSAARIETTFIGEEEEWVETGNMEIRANYFLPESLAENDERHYYGYLLRIYYDGKLQDERAEPALLLKLVPPHS